MISLTCPDRILVAGDWHGSTGWAMGVARMLPDLLPAESPRIVVQVGDFGIWRDTAGQRYLHKLTRALTAADAELYFAEGNHEDYPHLHKYAADPDGADAIPITDRITWLQRGHRWTWHGRTWLALGGAVSVDRATGREGKTWWRDEEITDDQARRVIEGGPADVMVCHDVPASVPLQLRPPRPEWAIRDLALAARHRERLQDVVDAVKPGHVFSGHHHILRHQTVSMDHGDVKVTVLDRDGTFTAGNYAVLDVRTMTYPKGIAA